MIPKFFCIDRFFYGPNLDMILITFKKNLNYDELLIK